MIEKLAIDGGDPVVTDGIPKGMHGPSVIDEQETNAVTKVLESQNLFRFSDNSEVLKFEQETVELLGVKHSLMVNSGTSAIICALTGGGIGPGDEVIVPGYTFIATAAAVVAVGAVPVIAEIDDSLGLDPTDVERKITLHTKQFCLSTCKVYRAELIRLWMLLISITYKFLRIVVNALADVIEDASSVQLVMRGPRASISTR